MNAHDSEKLIGILERIGYTEAEKEADANFVKSVNEQKMDMGKII